MAKQIRRLFVANRGEIAVRVIKACRTLGIQVVVGVSEADVESMAAHLADAFETIGPGPAAASYLDIDRVIAAARRAGCDALHPGYGFLSERPALARACAVAGITFVGPSPEAIEKMGDKITAVSLAAAAGVPCVPGCGALGDADEALSIAKEIGYPVLIKATAGGGGRGMRVVRDASELSAQMASAASEAGSAFGDETIYMEKFIEEARHVEIQIMGDQLGNIVHLGERECSTQRRHQKLIEESPSPAIDDALRKQMADCAIGLARAAHYFGAGTVEFVVDARDSRFYFLEMNTRIQVEHPVTELVTGIDLVAEQIRVAQGLPLSFSQENVKLSGHAIECRINAEDPNKNFLPKPGLISLWSPPAAEGVRIDSHCYTGYLVPQYYDSLIAKLIVHGNTRAQAIQNMRQALKAFRIEGIPSTVEFQLEVMNEPAFIEGRVTTRWVEETFLPLRKIRQKAAAQAAKSSAEATPYASKDALESAILISQDLI